MERFDICCLLHINISFYKIFEEQGQQFCHRSGALKFIELSRKCQKFDKLRLKLKVKSQRLAFAKWKGLVESKWNQFLYFDLYSLPPIAWSWFLLFWPPWPIGQRLWCQFVYVCHGELSLDAAKYGLSRCLSESEENQFSYFDLQYYL